MAEATSPRRPATTGVSETVRAVLERMTGRGILGDRVRLSRDLGLDATDRIELAVALELACRTELAPRAVEGAETVRDVIAVVERALGLEAPPFLASEALRGAIADLVAGAAAVGAVIDLSAATAVLAGDHAAAGWSLDDIGAELERTAAAAGVSIAAPGRIEKS